MVSCRIRNYGNKLVFIKDIYKENFMKNRIIAALTAAAFICISLSGCAAASKEPLTYTDTVFDTVVSITVYDSTDQEILDECKSMCQKYDAMFSATNPDSEISRINQAGGNPVEVSSETATLIKKGLYYGKLSNGAFDITIGKVSSLWDFKAENPSVPDSAAIASALEHVDYQKVLVSGNTVTMQDSQAAIDLGAIAKGYIADRLKDYLEEEGIRHANINLGGNVQTIGGKPDGSAFNIGIQEPFSESGIPLTSVKIKDQSIVTSGTYQRYFEKDGTIYHHILDPKTGYPCQNGLSSVTIITDSSLTADALSTTCFVLGPEDGLKLVNQLDNVDAVFIDSENEITYSTNFMK